MLRKQTENLNEQVWQYSLKEIKLENDSKELLLEKEEQNKLLNEKTLELKKLEENLKTNHENSKKSILENFETKQTEIKEKYLKEISELSKDLQTYTINCEKLKFENQKFHEKNEEISNLIIVKENEFNQMLKNKNTEKESLMKMLYEVNDEMILLENKFNHVNSELNENNGLIINELNEKSERLKHLEEESINLKELLQNLQHNYNNVLSVLKEKEDLYEQLNNQHTVSLYLLKGSSKGIY